MSGLRLVGCALLLALFDVLIAIAGMRRTLLLVDRLRVGRRRLRINVDETVRLVATAAAFYPRRALCLEQALALCWLLRRGGHHAELRLGVQPRPFRAHAWVEVAGRPVAERDDLPLNMVAFPRLAG